MALDGTSALPFPVGRDSIEPWQWVGLAFQREPLVALDGTSALPFPVGPGSTLAVVNSRQLLQGHLTWGGSLQS